LHGHPRFEGAGWAIPGYGGPSLANPSEMPSNGPPSAKRNIGLCTFPVAGGGVAWQCIDEPYRPWLLLACQVGIAVAHDIGFGQRMSRFDRDDGASNFPPTRVGHRR